MGKIVVSLSRVFAVFATPAVAFAAGKVALAAAAICIALPARAITTYRVPHTDVEFKDGFIPTGGRLVFPNLTLADLEGYWFWGRMAGGFVNAHRAFSNKPQVYPAGATGENIKRIDFDLACKDGSIVKAIHLQLYNGTGGVWAKTVQGWYFEKINSTYFHSIYYTVNQSTGTLSWSGPKLMNKIAASVTAEGYGVFTLGIAKPLTSTAKLVFPGATVAMFAKNAERKLSARVCGSQIGYDAGASYTIANAAVTQTEGEVPTALRFEAQYQDVKTSADVFLKCAVVELTNGEGGVYARVSKCLYKSGAEEGFRFVNADGTVAEGASDAGVLPSGDAVNGYSAFNLEATDLAVYRAEPSHWYDKYGFFPTSGGILVFPGMTLAQLEKAQFYGTMDGNCVGQGLRIAPNCYSMTYPVRYPSNTAEPVQKLYTTLSLQSDNDHKFVLVELTEQSDGVYATVPRCCHVTDKSNPRYRNTPDSVDSSGNIVLASGYSAHPVALEDKKDGQFYGLTAFGVAKNAPLPTEDAYVFPGVTAGEVLRGEIVGQAVGGSISFGYEKDRPYVFCNRVVESVDGETGAATAFRIEGHLNAPPYDKVAVLRFSDGEDGLEVRGALACYRNLLWNNVGRKAVNDAGTASSDEFKATTFVSLSQTGGYGVRDFGFALPDDVSGGPAYAVWNGGDPVLAASWTCRATDGTVLPDAVPDKFTYVTTAGNVAMTADADMTAFASFRPAANSTIDTAGHKFTVAALEPWPVATITDTVGGGELVVDIPAGMESVNAQIALSGKLKFVKKGEGCFVPLKREQTYTGGNQISGGKLMLGETGAATARYWGMGGYPTEESTAQIVQIDEGGFFDINGNIHMAYMSTIFNGGILYGSTTGLNTRKILTADSTIQLSGDMTAVDYPTAELNGHTLNLAIPGGKALNYKSPWTGPGTIRLVKSGDGGGTLKLDTNNFPDSSVNLDAAECALNIQTIVDVNDYTAGYNANYNWFGANAALRVHGTFTPKTAYFTAATMMGGSTIDISQRPLPWSARSSFSNGNQMKIADGANITLKLPEEVVIPEDEKEVIVVTNLANNIDMDVSRITCDLSNVRMADGSVPANIRLISSGTGLSVRKLPGLTIIVR